MKELRKVTLFHTCSRTHDRISYLTKKIKKYFIRKENSDINVCRNVFTHDIFPDFGFLR